MKSKKEETTWTLTRLRSLERRDILDKEARKRLGNAAPVGSKKRKDV